MYFSITPRTLNGETIETVDARDLHAELGVCRDFPTWIRDRIDEYGFVENQDFMNFPQNRGKSGRGRPRKEYAVTIDMAKELAMVERNERGRQVRRYFIECEKRLRQQGQATLPTVAGDQPSILRESHRVNLRSVFDMATEAADLWDGSVRPALAALDSPIADELGRRIDCLGAMAKVARVQPGLLVPHLG